MEDLDPAEREAFNQALALLMADPLPDGLTKMELPFFREPSIFAFSSGAFTMTYTFLPEHPLVFFVLGVAR